MSTEAVGAIWIGGAALNGALIWMSIGLSQLFGDAQAAEPVPEPEAVADMAQVERAA